MSTTTAKRRWFKRVAFIAIPLGLCLGIVIVGVLQARPVILRNYDECVRYGFVVTGSKPKICTAGDKAFQGPFEPDVSQVPVDIPFQTISGVSSTGNYPESNDIITNQVDWRTFWNKRHAGDSTNPYLPSIDFGQKVIVAISEGPLRTKAVGIQILSVKSGPTETVVSASMNKPGATCAAEPTTLNPVA
ncbi:MAG: hypothetical protein ABIS59_01520, partial [Candidatus Saccharibacteria bacterium]